MIPLAPILTQLLQNMILQLVQTAITEKIDNPYLRASLTAAANTFAEGLMKGLSPQELEEKMQQNLADTSGVPARELPPQPVMQQMARAVQ